MSNKTVGRGPNVEQNGRSRAKCRTKRSVEGRCGLAAVAWRLWPGRCGLAAVAWRLWSGGCGLAAVACPPDIKHGSSLGALNLSAKTGAAEVSVG